MRTITLHFLAADVTADEACAQLAGYSSYPALTAAVREVTLDTARDRTVLSTWTVRFRSGLLEWTERDVMGPLTRTIGFGQMNVEFSRSAASLEDVEVAGHPGPSDATHRSGRSWPVLPTEVLDPHRVPQGAR